MVIAAPSPVRSRTNRAVSTLDRAYIPAPMSAIGMPGLAGAPALPVIAHEPASDCASRSYARALAYGPPAP